MKLHAKRRVKHIACCEIDQTDLFFSQAFRVNITVFMGDEDRFLFAPKLLAPRCRLFKFIFKLAKMG